MGLLPRRLIRLKKPRLHVEQPKSTFAEGGNARWTNKDLDPVPPHARKWGVTSFIAYWISDAFNAATWQFGASVVALGLSWRESVGIVALSFFIVSIVVSLPEHRCPFVVSDAKGEAKKRALSMGDQVTEMSQH